MEMLKRLYEGRIIRAHDNKRDIIAAARARAIRKGEFTIIKLTKRELDCWNFYNALEQESRDKLAKIA